MSEQPIRYSAPGSVMLLGEHAVLHGGQALVAAINRRITLSLTARADNKIIINAATLGNYQSTLTALTANKKFAFVIAAIKQYQADLKHGLTIEITSDFSANLGLGSSAAVTVATLAAVRSYLKQPLESVSLIEQGCQVVRQVQGLGSGADIAATVLGGMVGYRNDPLQIQSYAHLPTIALIYSGNKIATAEVVNHLDQLWQDSPQAYRSQLTAIAECANRGCEAVAMAAWQQLAQQMNRQQQLMTTLQLSNACLDEIITQLHVLPNVVAAKISGAGLGDCVIALGQLAPNSFPRDDRQQAMGIKQLDVTITSQGVTCDSN
ncbi:MAG: mevalonate kinase [Gammaproteobacteria bacterium]|nr:mevalonate kinase [Gammaproteobacteria bacterium]MCP4474760.1 mevalonate kinase [Gammaproteobacteria bacterium]